MLWSLWTTWNNVVFNDVKFKDGEIEKGIKSRAWQWSLTQNLLDDKWYNLWCISPLDAYERHRKNGLNTILNLWFGSNLLVGFVDGSLMKAQDGTTIAGIGGYLLDKNRKAVYIF